MTRTSLLLAVLLCGVATPAAAQPATDIFLADVMLHDGRLHIGRPLNVTGRDGYDNQPWFLPDGRSLLYVSGRDGQTDVYRYDIAAGTSSRVTNTPENEYSPSLPLDGSRMMVVRWANDMSTGDLWWYAPDGAPLEVVRGSVPRVGYYTFVGDSTLALFINDSVQSFVLSNLHTGDTLRVGQDLGGSAPRTVPGERAVSFLRRHEDGTRWLSRLDVDTRVVTPLVEMLRDVANYTWTPRGTVLAASGGTILEWTRDGGWQEVASFSDPALQGITRIALSPAGDRIALVSARPAEPR